MLNRWCLSGNLSQTQGPLERVALSFPEEDIVSGFPITKGKVQDLPTIRPDGWDELAVGEQAMASGRIESADKDGVILTFSCWDQLMIHGNASYLKWLARCPVTLRVERTEDGLKLISRIS